ncbi:hypothetical protein [Paenibacillus sp. DYY-L-2]|uniref:hypothetical protein n=1 Tax=Paenibacillus sp. DYY-L-2 TaxID=3447013 RepID=UPI003F4FA8A8
MGKPASFQATLMACLSWGFFGCFGAALLSAAGRGSGKAFMERGWLVLAGGLAVTALAAVIGWLPVPEAILRTEDREVAAAGARLGGLLQYPNTFGAVMAAALLERLTALARLPAAAFSRTARWQGVRTGALAPVFALCLLLSESRGALAAAAVGWAAGALLLRGQERLRYALHSGACLAAAALLARPLAAAQLAPPAVPGALTLAAGLALALGMAALAHRAAFRAAAFRPLAGGLSRARRFAAPAFAAAAALGALAAIAGLSGRLASAATLHARGALYADALRLLREAPWFGRGGDAWRTLFRGIQSGPYVGSEVHSGYLDIALDLGLAGLAVLLCWLGVLMWPLFKTRSRLLPALTVLLVHSAADFDMSYGLVWLLVLWLAAWGGLGGFGLTAQAAVNTSAAPSPSPSPCSGTGPKRLMAGLLSFALLTAGASGLGQAVSLGLQRSAVQTAAVSQAESARRLELAVALAPARSDATLALAAMSAPESAAAILHQALSFEPNDPCLMLAYGKALAQQNRLDALVPLRRAVLSDRYNRSVQTTALRELEGLASRLHQNGRTADSAVAAFAGLELYREFVRLAKQPWNGRNDRDFRVTDAAVGIAEKLESMLPANRGPKDILLTAESLPERP